MLTGVEVASVMPSQAIQQLVEQGRQSGLFSTAVAQELMAQMTAYESLTAEEVASRMVEKRIMTRFQAEQLLAGRGEEWRIAVVGDANFLRPRLNSSLATGGGGGDLPPYVGAVPPEGTEPWNWDKTWNGLVTTPAVQASQMDKE